MEEIRAPENTDRDELAERLQRQGLRVVSWRREDDELVFVVEQQQEQRAS